MCVCTYMIYIRTTRRLPIRVRGGGAAAPVVMMIFVCAVNFDSRRHTLLSMGFDNVEPPFPAPSEAPTA